MPRIRTVCSALLVAAAYALSAVINLSITYQSTSISPIWPPNTILLVALLLVPTETWWVYLLAVFGAHMLVELPGPLSLAAVTGLYFTNAGEAVLGAFLVRRFIDGAPWLGTLRKMTVYLVCAVVVAPVITSFGDAAVFMVTRSGGTYWLNWETRCVSNILTELTIGPALLLALSGGRSWMRGTSRRRWVEVALLSVLLLLVSVVTLGEQITSHRWAPLIVFAVLPLLFWAAVRFGVGGTSAALLGLTIVATWSAANGRGPFSANTAAETVISLQLFLIYISIPMLILAAVIDDRQRALWALRASEARYRAVVETQTEMITRYRPDLTLTFVNEATCRFVGKSREELLGTSMVADTPAEAATHLREMVETLLAQPDPGIVTIEHQTRSADGSLRWQQWVNRAIVADNGQVIELQGIGRDITERKRAEEALSRSEERYRDLVESQTEMVCRYLPDSTLTFVNEALCRMYGKPREQLIGTKFYDRMDQPAHDHHTQYTAQVLARADTTATDEHEFTLPDGTVVWQQWVDHPIYDVEGQVIEIQAVGRDITERKQAEEALRASEARYRTVMRNLPNAAVVLFDAELRHSFADGPGLQVLGLTPAEVEGRTVWETFPHDLAAALAPGYAAVRSGQTAEMDVEYAQHIYRIQALPMPMPTPPAQMTAVTSPPAQAPVQTPVGMVVLRDITEQRRARDELVRERTLTALLGALSHEFQTLAEHSPDFIGRLDPSGHVLYVNQAGADLLGLPAEQVVGKTFAELGTRQEAYEPWVEALRETMETRAPHTFDAEAHTPDSHVFSLHARYIPEFDEDGALVSVLGIATDVSALKRAEARLAEQASELESIFEAQADGVGVYDLQGRFVRANAALRELLGLDADADYTALPFEERAQRLLLYDNQGEPLPLAQWPQWRVLRGEILAGASAMEVGVRTLDGRDLWISITGAPMRAPGGQATGVVLIARDVTAHRALERQVAEQAAEHEAIFEAQADGVLVYDRQGRVARTNRAWQAMFRAYTELSGLASEPGFAALPFREQVERWNELERLHQYLLKDAGGHEIPQEELPYSRALRGETVTGANAVDERFESPDGRVFDVSVTAAPVRNAAGSIVGAVAVARDVTTQRQLERQVREQAAELEAILEAMADGMLVHDVQGVVLRVNQAYRDLVGLDAEPDYLARSLNERRSRMQVMDEQGHTAQEGQGVSQRVLHGEVVRGQHASDMHIHTLDGRDVWVNTSGAPIRAPDGHISGAVLIARDVTARRALEARLAEQAAELETILQAMADGILVRDLEGNWIYANDAYRGLLRRHLAMQSIPVEPDALDTRPLSEWERHLAITDERGNPIPRESWATERALRGEILTGESAVDQFTRGADGSLLQVSVTAAPVRDARGQITGTVAVLRDVTARRALERQVTEQAAQLEAIFEAKADGVAVYDLQGRFVRANAVLRELFGFDADPEYTARPLDERAQRLLLFDEQGQALSAEQWPHWRVMRGEILAGATALEGRIRTVDGRELWISTTGAPLHGPDGQVNGTVLITRDVTARRALERQLAEQANELATIFEAQADGVAVFDLQGHCVRANSAMRHLLGYDADGESTSRPREEQAQRLLLFDEQGQQLPTDQWPLWRVLRGEVLAGASAVEALARMRDGRELWISTTGAPIRGPDEQITGVVLITRDVTARRALERQAAEQERQFRTLVENSPDVIARYDRNLRYLYINPAIARLSALPPEQYVGKTNREIGLPEAAYGAALQAIEEVFRTGRSRTLLEDDAASRGSENARYYRAQLLPEFAENGTVESVLTITTEITELKRAEAALRAANASVEAARHEEERRKRIAESLRDVLSMLNSTRSPHDILSYIVSQVGELLGGEAAVIYGQDGLIEGTLSEVPATTAVTAFGVQAAHGLLIDGRQPCPQEHLPFAESAIKYALSSERPVALLDASALPLASSITLATAACVSSDPDHAAETVETAETAAMPLLHGTMPAPYRALLVVPIRVHDAVYGCLLLFYTQPYVFAPEEVALARTYADQVALAIGNARLQAHIEREAAAAERTRLAHELHDTVTQEMYSAVLLTESITRNWQGHRAAAEMALQQVPGVIRGALAGLRTLLFELRPATLDQLPLSGLLRQLGEAMSTRADVPIAVQLNDSEGASSDVEPPLPPAVKVVFYRVAQEALMNAAKYARAHAISVQLRTRGRGTRSTIELEITDDGRGFDPSAISPGHFGLAIMRERARAVGATVQIRSQPGQGTQIVAAWPRERGERGDHVDTMPEAANGQPREPANGRPRDRRLKGGTA